MALFGKKRGEEVPQDLDAVMKKFDRDSNTRVWTGKWKLANDILLAAFSLFCLYVTLFAAWLDEVRLTSFVALIVFEGYIVYPARRGRHRPNSMPWYDIALMALGTAAFLYYTFNADSIIQQGAKFKGYQIAIGIVGILALAEVCRRSVGLPILVVAAGFIAYALTLGLNNPRFSGRLNYLVRNLFYTKEGILSTPINTCNKYIVVFILFGAFLERTGISDLFIRFSNLLVGRYSGGPAKVAVVSSALLGTVSGSSVANTVGSGSVTIPMMKRTGYRGEFAGAVEASASTGGQIMPPIMGAAAFLMADNLGLPYRSVIVKAILPAALYFLGIFIMVHLEAKKTGLKGLDRSEIPQAKALLRRSYLLLPLALLIWMVSANVYTMQKCASIAIAATILVSLPDKNTRMGPMRLLDALAAGGKGALSVSAACGIAGIIAGTITMTGLANVLINGIVAVAGSRVIVALFLTMLCCIVLGMGVPTTATYCIMAATCAPILIRMGVPAICAHFFVFYFGIVADLTPPVALAAYAGAAIAKADPMKTAVNATKLSIAAFIVPYVFAMNPMMLFEGLSGGLAGAWTVMQIVLTSMLGTAGVAVGVEGYLRGRMHPLLRIASLAGGLLLIAPDTLTDAIGIALLACAALAQFASAKRAVSAK